MDTKKWPVLAKLLIGFGIIGGLMNIATGFTQKDIIAAIAGVAGVIIYWSVYKFKGWALIGLNILLSLDIILISISLFNGTPLAFGLGIIALRVFVIIYFNSKRIKELFHPQSALQADVK